ncbi:histidine kinase N-terminal domain-containing protein [Evansella clarkii]|uniref:histidine kinase N-terminal domain-containing protein n=1 Tax=Evansella clarkii TaxID=79879 RepID=UPI000998A4EC|nr:histidine kinase N-terminal domain-containing protein [Evansella clarkii]
MASFSHNCRPASEIIVEYLEKNLPDFLEVWEEKIKIEENDKYKDNVRINGLQMYELVKQTMLGSIEEKELRSLAEAVAYQRMEAGSNIGEFVYNVNVGRSIIIKQVNSSGVSVAELTESIDKINSQFDQFCYFAVTKYTELINKKLEEKQKYIADTHKDKLAILGQMSSSFVHEFRNPLTSIMGFTKLLRKDFPGNKYLEIIEMELDQLNYRITQFLHTSRIDTSEKRSETFDLEELCNEIIKFIYPSLLSEDVIVTSENINDVYVKGNASELKQVFLNILFNSIDALKLRDKPRKIHIVCHKIEDRADITISNNGPPIPKEIKETIFEPFYTTKELGTGIGLFVSKSIVEKYGGEITCESGEELTYFKIVLPMDTK